MDRHSLHSPFVFELNEKLIQKKNAQYFPENIEKQRQSLLQDQREIEQIDFGAKGNASGKIRKRKIAEIAKTSLSNKRFCLFLAELANHAQSQTILELGTSLGIQSAYLAHFNPKANILSFEGDPSCLTMAMAYWQQQGYGNIQGIAGALDNSLADTLNSLSSVDLVYMDANHTYEATMRYYHLIKSLLHPKSIVVLDDIHWSKGMYQAWKELCSQEEVSLSLDLFDAGILFFRPELQKEHYLLSL